MDQHCERADINQTLKFLQTGDPWGSPVPSYCCDTVPIQSLLIKKSLSFQKYLLFIKDISRRRPD